MFVEHPIIQVHQVSKSYGNLAALNAISFEIQKGSVFGLLGPNGAGKSTSINILSTLLDPDSGEVVIDGMNLREHKAECKRIIGVVPQEIALYRDLSAYDNLLFWGGLYKIPKPALRKKALEILELVGLSDRKNEPIQNYSGGMKRRVNIAASLLHKPKVLLLDEPTVGIDPQSRSYIFDIIRQLNDDGMTVIYTTHYMEEAEKLCNTIGIIDSGNIVAMGSMETLRKISKTQDSLRIQVSEISETIAAQLATKMRLRLEPDSRMLAIDCEVISDEIAQVLADIQEAGLRIESMETQRANLESVFLKLTGKHLRD